MIVRKPIQQLDDSVEAATDGAKLDADQVERLNGYIPLRFHARRADWRPLLGQGEFCAREIDAGRICHKHVLELWVDTVLKVRTARALCEHPNFVFAGNGIDSDLIRAQMVEAANALEAMTLDLERLLDPPEPSDTIRLEPDPNAQTSGNNGRSDLN